MSVWITRSSPDNLSTARRIRALGQKPLMVPLLATRPLPQDRVAVPPTALVFTSVHAVRHHAFDPALLTVPVFAASGHVAELAVSTGYASVTSTYEDEAALLGILGRVLPSRSRVLMFCADRSSGELAERLGELGHVVDRQVAYEPTPVPDGTISDVLRTLDHVGAIVVHSRGGADRLAPILRRTAWRGSLWCISQQTAERLSGLNGVSIHVADQPTERSLLEMIARQTVEGAARRPAKPIERALLPSTSPYRHRRRPRRPHNDNDPGPGGSDEGPGPSAA